MQLGTVCVILDDGSSNCPDSLLAKKILIQQHLDSNLTPHDRFKLMMMHDMGLNLNHLIAASKVIDYYNRMKKNELAQDAVDSISFGFNTASTMSDHLADISRSFVEKMDHLNAMQYRLIGAHGKEAVAAKADFKVAYRDAMNELNRVAKLNFVSADTQSYFDNQMRVRAFGRTGVYVNDLEDVERLKKIAETTKTINSIVAKFAIIGAGTQIIFDAATGGNWQKDVKDTIIEYVSAGVVGRLFAFFTPEGWIVFLLECALQVYASDQLSDVLDKISNGVIVRLKGLE